MVMKIPNQTCEAGEACEACETHFLIKIFLIIKKTRIGRFGASKIIQEKAHKDFELYQVLLRSFLCQNFWMFPLYIMLTS